MLLVIGTSMIQQVWFYQHDLARLAASRFSALDLGFSRRRAAVRNAFDGSFPVFHVCSACEPSPTHAVSTLFPLFPVFLVVEYMATMRALRPSSSDQEIQNIGNSRDPLDCTR